MSRNVRVAGALLERGETNGMPGFALFTACSTSFLIFPETLASRMSLFLLPVRVFETVETTWL
jgi:hypothetical protein